MAQNTNVWPAIVTVAAILLILNSLVIFYAVPNEVAVNVDFSEVNENLVALNDKVVGLQVTENETEVLPIIVLTKSEQEDEAIEDKAMELALESVDSRDFKKAVFDLLVTENRNIESYKDITEVKIVESEVDENEVVFDVKIYYYLDGDEDETERARFNEFTIEVDDLDFDDDFEDAEVIEDYLDNLTVLRIYD